MGILKVANVHFNSSGSNRLSFQGSNTIFIIPGSNGINISQNTVSSLVANTISYGSPAKPFANVYLGLGRSLDLNGSQLSQNTQGLNISGPSSFSFDQPLVGSDGSIGSLLPPTVQIFTSSGTWTRPAYCKMIKVSLIGGGGGGGGATSSDTVNGGGGGGASGGIAHTWINVSNWSNSTTVTIGTGGAGGTSGGQGTVGNTSSFGTHLTCGGGDTGGGMLYTTAGSIARSGGWDLNDFVSGSYYGATNVGFVGMRFDTQSCMSGSGGAGLFGGSAPGHNAGANTASDGVYGGGGGGAAAKGNRTTTGITGGRGGDGICVVEEFY